MSKVKSYLKFTLDDSQEKLVESLDEISSDLSKNIFLRYFMPHKYKGVYIYGNVGRGKTEIVNAFLKSLDISSQIFHYQGLIKNLHQETHKMQKANVENPISIFAKNLVSKGNIIFIDELEIKDITDSWMINRLTEELLILNAFIIFTSNTPPSKLFFDAIHKDQVDKLIARIKDNFFISNLDGDKDYRYTKISSNEKTIFNKVNDSSDGQFLEIVNKITNNRFFTKTEINVFGRVIPLKNSFEKTLFFKLDEILNDNFSKNEYQEITLKFEVIIIDASNFKFDSSDKIIKFVNLIDNIYLGKLLFIALFDNKPNLLYSNGKYLQEFKRAISRIREMKSEEYIQNTKYYNNDK